MSSNRRPTLLLIDVQKGFCDPIWGQRNNPTAEKKMAALLARWRERGLPIIHVQHLSMEPDSPLQPGQPGVDFHPLVCPVEGEIVIRKRVNSAFIGTDLDLILRRNFFEELVLVGLTTDHCVSTTARMASNLGYGVTVVADATATFNRRGPEGDEFKAELVHQTALASLMDEFAAVRFADSL